jgi:hypothetical protein
MITPNMKTFTPIMKMITSIRKLVSQKKICVILFLTCVIFQSCEKNITVEVPHAESEVVVEGYIETGKAPFVILSNSLPFFGTISTSVLDNLQYTITGATVTVDNGTVIDTLEQLPGYGVYFSQDMVGEAGKSYSLKIKTGEKIITATTYIPPSIHLDSVWFKVDGNRDSLGYAWAHLTDPDTLGNYYRWFAQRINHYTYGDLAGKMKDTLFIAPRGSVFEDKFINGRSFDFAYNRGVYPNSDKDDDENDERGFFKRGDTIIVKFCTIDRAHFEFWRTEETQVGNNGNPFGSPAPVTSNINGGLGIWGGYNVTYDTIIAH